MNPPQCQYSWPNPPKKPSILVSIASSPNVAPADKPFIGPEYPTPKRKSYLITSINTYSTTSADKPFKQDNWPNPLLKKRLANTWINFPKLAESTTNFMPCSVLDWPNPAPKRKIALTHIGQIAQLQQLNTRPTSIPPIYPNRLDAKKSALTWIQSRPSYYTEFTLNPFGVIEWKNPVIRKETLLISHLQKFNSTEAIGNPFNQKDWLNPIRKKRLPEQWDFYYQQDDNQPPVAQSYNIPLIKRIPTLSWLQSPLVSTPISGVPFTTVIFDNPILEKKLAQSWVNPSLSVSELPISQSIWVNPITRNRLPQTWIQSRPIYYTDLIPFMQDDWPNPLRTRILNRGYIFNQQIGEISYPRTYNYPNPRLVRRQIESWVNNLLQSTLNPGAGQTPFSQTDWAIPNRKKLGLDWIFSRPFIFEVSAVPFEQNDWPNPLVAKRSPTGYINYLIPEEEIKVSSILDIPLRKKTEAITWLQSLLGNTLGPLPITSFTQKDWPNPPYGRRNRVGFAESRINYITGDNPFGFIEFRVPNKKQTALTWAYSPLLNLVAVAGIQPFSQYNWPIPIRARTNYGILNINGQDFIILPNIIGRAICLDSSITEYYLISSIEDYDLESSITEYNLDSGGDECQ